MQNIYFTGDVYLIKTNLSFFDYTLVPHLVDNDL